MIGYLKGKIVLKLKNAVVLETGGVGYRVFVEPKILEKNKISGELELFIYNHIREGVDDLFGFACPGDLEIFELLLSASGVGPKVALNIVGSLGGEKIISAISKGDPTVFRAVSGVGGKVAAKIIVELKNKISDDAQVFMPEEDETIDALFALGFQKNEILPYLREIPDNLTETRDKVRFILKNVGKRK